LDPKSLKTKWELLAASESSRSNHFLNYYMVVSALQKKCLLLHGLGLEIWGIPEQEFKSAVPFFPPYISSISFIFRTCLLI